MFKISKLTVIITGGVIIVFLVWWGSVSYRPRLLNRGSRNPAEIVRDFFSFGWHFSRQAWMRRSRDWSGAERERLLAFWCRPDYPVYDELRKMSLMELAQKYDKVSLWSRAAELYLYVHRENIDNYWLARKVGDKLYRLEDWEKLEIVARDILKYQPGNEEAQRWLKKSGQFKRGRNE